MLSIQTRNGYFCPGVTKFSVELKVRTSHASLAHNSDL